MYFTILATQLKEIKLTEVYYSDYAFLVLRLCVKIFSIQTTLQRSQYQIEYQKQIHLFSFLRNKTSD
jgi:hypothetical protein